MSKVRYLDPRNDLIFRRVFGEHPRLLKSFLNAVLPLNADEQIESLEYLNPDQIPNIPTFKRSIVDVKCRDKHGRIFIVEMQMNWTDSFKQRLLFGTSQAVVKSLDKGDDYNLMQTTYGLGLVNVSYEQDNPIWYHHYQLVKINEGHYPDVIKHLQLVFVELPKFPVRSADDKQLRILWLRFLREINQDTTEVSPELLAVPEIKEAVELAAESAYSPKDLIAYEKCWDEISREKTLLTGHFRDGLEKGMEIGLEKGRIDGMEIGVEKGREEGMEIGLEKGMEQKAVLIAKSLLSLGVALNVIAQSTGLSTEEIQALQ